MTIHHFLSTLVGPAGRYLRGLWDPDEVLANLFWTADVRVSRAVAVQIIKGNKPVPVKYTACYRHDDGYDLLCDDLHALLQHYVSRAMLQAICARIHMDVSVSGWQPDQIAALDAYYVADNPTRDEMATYLAHVLHHIICA